MKILIKLITVIALTINCYTAYSQDCNCKVDKKDKFTGEIYKELEPVLLLKTHKEGKTVKISKLSMILKNQGVNKIFTLKFSLRGKGLPSFNKMLGCKLILLLENGKKVQLPMTGGMTSDYIKLDVFTHFAISDENMKELCSSKITDVRVASMMNPFDFQVNETINSIPYFKCLILK